MTEFFVPDSDGTAKSRAAAAARTEARRLVLKQEKLVLEREERAFAFDLWKTILLLLTVFLLPLLAMRYAAGEAHKGVSKQ